jgi:excisionase family DNA binding protein
MAEHLLQTVDENQIRTAPIMGSSPASVASGDQLLRADQVAEYLQISVTTLAVWRSTRRVGLPYCKVGGRVRYRRSDVDAYLDSQMRTPPPDTA